MMLELILRNQLAIMRHLLCGGGSIASQDLQDQIDAASEFIGKLDAAHAEYRAGAPPRE